MRVLLRAGPASRLDTERGGGSKSRELCTAELVAGPRGTDNTYSHPFSTLRSSPMSDVGLQLINALFRSLKIDRRWCHTVERGFRWWPGHLAQTCWAEP